MPTRNVNIWRTVDWVTIILYLFLVIGGWLSICGASYSFGEIDFFSLDSRMGKQLMWIGLSFGLGFILLMLESKFYENFSYILYVGMMLLLAVTIVIATDVKGSRSWLHLGPVSLQPAEFAKFATALALAKFMSIYGFSLKNKQHLLVVLSIIFLPVGLIIMQHETGSALVYLAFIVMLYREGMPGIILVIGGVAVAIFVIAIRYSYDSLLTTPTELGTFLVLFMIITVSSILYGNYCKRWKEAGYMFFINLLLTILVTVIASTYYSFNIVYVQLFLCILFLIYSFSRFIIHRKRNYLLVLTFPLLSIGYLYSCSYVFNKVLQPHQQVRIKVLLGLENDLTGAGYNVNQSKIAIGSGGLLGKGFLNGTQTKLSYVPEQDTDFIFCTIGEEQGFIGSSLVLLLFLSLILRLIYLAERQGDAFSRIYGYSIACIFLFHIFINIGMVLGITPVIGIPLPFFSYGGSSLWGFTILLFIFLRLDASRKERLK
jgi:rod shape determining protein RodA